MQKKCYIDDKKSVGCPPACPHQLKCLQKHDIKKPDCFGTEKFNQSDLTCIVCMFVTDCEDVIDMADAPDCFGNYYYNAPIDVCTGGDCDHAEECDEFTSTVKSDNTPPAPDCFGDFHNNLISCTDELCIFTEECEKQTPFNKKPVQVPIKPDDKPVCFNAVVYCTTPGCIDYDNCTAVYKPLDEQRAPIKTMSKEKPDLSLLPLDLLEELAIAYMYGIAKDYPRYSWRKGFPQDENIAAAYRHISAYWDKGEMFDPEAKELQGMDVYHIAMAVFNLLCVLDSTKNHPQFDNRYEKEKNENK